jgi:hypothetical protein
MSKNYYSHEVIDGALVLQTRDIASKETIWGWAGGGGPSARLYGTDVAETPFRGDYALWKWKLDRDAAMELLKGLVMEKADPKRFNTDAKGLRRVLFLIPVVEKYLNDTQGQAE